MTASTLETVSIEAIFGMVVLDSRMRSDGDRLIGEGRALHYDQNGVLIKDTGWQPTGVMVIWPQS